MRVRIECVAELQSQVAVVLLTGTLDVAGAATVRGCLLGSLIDQPVAVVVDLSGVSVADDLALTLLPEVARRAAEWPGAELLLCSPGPHTSAALDRVGVTGQLRVLSDRQEAIAVAASQPTPHRVRQQLPPVVDAPRLARDLVAQATTTWRLPADPAQVAQVIATELVTNAVRHAGTPMDFSVALRDARLQLAVCDGDPSPPRRRTILTEHDDHGRGLQLVDGLAAAWGCVPTPGGKVVWASVPAR